MRRKTLKKKGKREKKRINRKEKGKKEKKEGRKKMNSHP